MASVEEREAAGYKIIAEHGDNQLFVDEKGKRFATSRSEYTFNDLVSAELEEDDDAVTTTHTNKKVSLGKAAVGGILLGGVGAIIGGSAGKEHSKSTNSKMCELLRIKLTLNTLDKPTRYINFIDHTINKGSSEYGEAYNHAEQFMGVFQFILNNK